MRLALAEMRRAKLRFGLLTGAVALLVFLILFQQTLASALLGFFTGAIENQSAEVLVFDEDARRNVEGSVILPGEMEAVAGVEGVRRAAPLGEGTFTVDAGGELRDAVLFGYSLGGPGAPTAVSEGRLPAADGEAVASSVDADDGFGIGDVVEAVLQVPPSRGRSRRGVAVQRPADAVRVLPHVRSEPHRQSDAEAVLPSLIAVDAEPGVDAVGLRPTSPIRRRGGGLDRDAVQSLPGVAAVNSSFASSSSSPS
jgi:putative ABC transport system permease protein